MTHKYAWDVVMEHDRAYILEATVFKPGLDLTSHIAPQEDGLWPRLLGNAHEDARMRICGIEWIAPAKFVKQVAAKGLGLVSSHVHSHLPRLYGSA